MELKGQLFRLPGAQADDASDQPIRVSSSMIQRLRRPPTAAFEALLDQADPQGDEPIVAVTRSERRVCGRWLAVQRLHLGLSNAVVSERTGVDIPTLLLLESGLATDAQVTDSIRENLSRILAARTDNEGRVLDVLTIALGRSNERKERIVQQVIADLNSTFVGSSDQSHPRSPANLDGYELFRRAVVDQDADAWTEISLNYRTMMIAWVRRCHAADISGESYEDLADEALARAWRALSPKRFAQFPNLAALLAYLRTCVTATVIDAARARTSYERMAVRVEHSTGAQPDQAVLEQLDRAELWQLASSLVVSETERIVLLERFVLDLPPRAIQARHPALFPEVRGIFETIRTVCDRLRRNQKMRRFYNESLSA